MGLPEPVLARQRLELFGPAAGWADMRRTPGPATTSCSGFSAIDGGFRFGISPPRCSRGAIGPASSAASRTLVACTRLSPSGVHLEDFGAMRRRCRIRCNTPDCRKHWQRTLWVMLSLFCGCGTLGSACGEKRSGALSLRKDYAWDGKCQCAPERATGGPGGTKPLSATNADGNEEPTVLRGLRAQTEFPGARRTKRIRKRLGQDDSLPVPGGHFEGAKGHTAEESGAHGTNASQVFLETKGMDEPSSAVWHFAWALGPDLAGAAAWSASSASHGPVSSHGRRGPARLAA
jgi:hypothetical protein